MLPVLSIGFRFRAHRPSVPARARLNASKIQLDFKWRHLDDIFINYDDSFRSRCRHRYSLYLYALTLRVWIKAFPLLDVFHHFSHVPRALTDKLF